MDLRLVLNVFTSNVQWNVGSYDKIVITIVASYTVKILFLLLLCIRNSVWMATNWYFLGYYGGDNYHSPFHQCDMSNQQYNNTVFCKTFVVKLRCRWKVLIAWLPTDGHVFPLASFQDLPMVQFLITCSGGWGPRPFYHVNDISVYLGKASSQLFYSSP